MELVATYACNGESCSVVIHAFLQEKLDAPVTAVFSYCLTHGEYHTAGELGTDADLTKFTTNC